MRDTYKTFKTRLHNFYHVDFCLSLHHRNKDLNQNYGFKIMILVKFVVGFQKQTIQEI